MSYKRGNLDYTSLEKLGRTLEIELAAIQRGIGSSGPTTIVINSAASILPVATGGIAVTIVTATTTSPQVIPFPSMGGTNYTPFGFVLFTQDDGSQGIEVIVPQVPPFTDTRTATSVQVTWANAGTIYLYIVKQ